MKAAPQPPFIVVPGQGEPGLRKQGKPTVIFTGPVEQRVIEFEAHFVPCGTIKTRLLMEFQKRGVTALCPIGDLLGFHSLS